MSAVVRGYGSAPARRTIQDRQEMAVAARTQGCISKTEAHLVAAGRHVHRDQSHWRSCIGWRTLTVNGGLPSREEDAMDAQREGSVVLYLQREILRSGRCEL